MLTLVDTFINWIKREAELLEEGGNPLGDNAAYRELSDEGLELIAEAT